MKIIVNNEDIYPSIDSLSELFEAGIGCEVIDDSKIAVKFDDPNIRVAENQDMTRMLSKGSKNADASLAYFVIKNRRIIASGNLQKNDDGDYACDGPFRVFSNIKVSTSDYVLAGQVDVSDLFALNRIMLNSTLRDTESKKGKK